MKIQFSRTKSGEFIEVETEGSSKSICRVRKLISVRRAALYIFHATIIERQLRKRLLAHYERRIFIGIWAVRCACSLHFITLNSNK